MLSCSTIRCAFKHQELTEIGSHGGQKWEGASEWSNSRNPKTPKSEGVEWHLEGESGFLSRCSRPMELVNCLPALGFLPTHSGS